MLDIGEFRTAYRWTVVTTFTGRVCRATCIDRVPDEGAFEHPLGSPTPTATPTATPTVTPTVTPSVSSDRRLTIRRTEPARRLSSPWGRSSVGRAPPLQGGGRRFESGRLHRGLGYRVRAGERPRLSGIDPYRSDPTEVAMKRSRFVVLLVVGAFVLAACGGGDDDDGGGTTGAAGGDGGVVAGPLDAGGVRTGRDRDGRGCGRGPPGDVRRSGRSRHLRRAAGSDGREGARGDPRRPHRGGAGLRRLQPRRSRTRATTRPAAQAPPPRSSRRSPQRARRWTTPTSRRRRLA